MSAMCAGVEVEESVYTLVTSLCKKGLEKNEPLQCVASKYSNVEADLKKLRALSFGILLGKTHQDDKQKQCAEKDLNPMAQLIAYSYHLHASQEKRLGSQLDHCIDEVLGLGLEGDTTFMGLIQLMTLLKDTGSGRNDLLRQDPFDLSRIYPPIDVVAKNSSSPGPMPYSTPSPSLFSPPHWMNCHQSVLQEREYSAQFPFNLKPGEGLRYLSKFNALFQKDSVTSRPAYNVRTIGALSGPRGLSFASPSSSVIVQEDEGYFTPDLDKPPERTHSGTPIEDPTEIWSKALLVEEPLHRNWDSRGLPVADQDLPYLSAAPPIATLHVWQIVKLDSNILAETRGQQVSWNLPDAKPISRQLFLEHAVYLLQGIESHSFLYQEETDDFVVRPGLWVDGLTPDGVVGLSEDLLICGTYFRRLERMTHRQSFHSKEGTIVQALRGSLRRFVQSYRASVLNISAEMNNQAGQVSLFSLIRRIHCLKQQVECLTRLYNVTPGGTVLPSGIELLPHIYQQLCRSMLRSQTCVLYSALTSCCEVYYRRLERWIFLGNCFDDDREEFFIRPDIQYASKRNRLFWTKSFVLNEALVPDFFRGLETTVFQCGRAVHLLRLCNPGHPLCVLLEKEHPTIRFSLQMSDLEAVERECSKFEAEVRRVCGDFVTVAGIIREAREQECRVQQLIQKSNEERAIAQAAKAAKLARERAAAKQAQLQELKEQMFAAEQRHQAMIEREREEDARFLEETKKIEEMAEMARQEERAKLLRYYEALNEHIMRRERRVEWRLKRLQLSDRREQFLADDANRLKETVSSSATKDSEFRSENPGEVPEVCGETPGEVPEVRTETSREVPEVRTESPEEEVPTGKLLDLSDTPSEPQINEMLEMKKKMLKEEFGIDTEESNRVVDTSLTDYFSCLESAKAASMQAGVIKRKMMESEFGIIPAPQTVEEVATAEREGGSLLLVESDYFSCLGSAKEATVQAGVNRRKMMESEFGMVPASQTGEEVATADQEGGSPVLGESAAQAVINKRKMMGSEFGMVPASQTVEEVAKADREDGPSVLGESSVQAVINKRKMMESEFGIIPASQTVEEVAKADREDGPSVLGESSVQAVINKRKMMESEFGIIPASQTGEEVAKADREDGPSVLGESAVQAVINKRKMMESEFGMVPASQTGEAVAKADREDGPSVLGESAVQAVINKRKMMESEFGMVPASQTGEAMAKADREDGPSVLGESAVQAVINKRKMMESEFGITSLQPAGKEDAPASTVAGEEAEKNRVTMMKSSCFDPSISELSDLERNRRRVLQEEFQFEPTDKSPSKTSKTSDQKMSERQRNKLRVMGEEFDLLTGAPRRRHVRIFEQPTQESSSVNSEAIADEIETVEKIAGAVSSDSGFVSAATVAERPKVLQLTSKVTENETVTKSSSIEDQLSNTSSDRLISRAYSIDSSLFKRTPSTPFSMTTSFGTSVTVDGAPPIVDILDRFLGPAPAAPALTPTPSEASGLADVSPSAVWLGTSLQQGLLIPLRTHHGLVSSALLQFFLRDLNLLGHLRSLRSYFFLLDGEFGRRLTSQVFTQMYQVATPAGLLNGLTLNNLLASALSQSYSGADPNSNLLSFSVSTVPQHFSHSSPGALDCLHLHYRATWPINLILTEEALEKYNLIFVFLIRLRRVSWLLQEDFIVLKSTARQCNSQQRRDLLNSPEYHQVQIIRHCMSQFVQATQSYVTSAVLQASWTHLEQALQQATTLDHIYNAHIAYIKHVLKRCLLNQNTKRIEAVLNKVLSFVLQFHSLVRVKAWQAAPSAPGHRGYLQHPNFSKMVVCFKMFKLQVCKLTCYLEKLVAPPHQQSHLAEFLLLINLKDYYPASDFVNYMAESTSSAAE